MDVLVLWNELLSIPQIHLLKLLNLNVSIVGNMAFRKSLRKTKGKDVEKGIHSHTSGRSVEIAQPV